MTRQRVAFAYFFDRHQTTACVLALLWLAPCAGCATQHFPLLSSLHGHVPIVRFPMLADQCAPQHDCHSCHTLGEFPVAPDVNRARPVLTAGRPETLAAPYQELRVDRPKVDAPQVRSSAFVEQLPPTRFLPVPTRPVFGSP